MENEVVRHHERQREKFIDEAINLWREHGKLSLEDLSRLLGGHAGEVADAISKPIESLNPTLWEGGKDEALRLLDPANGIQRGRTGSLRKRAQLDPEDRRRVQDGIQKALTKVKTVGPEQIEKIREELLEGGATPDVVVRLLQREYYDLPPPAAEQMIRNKLGYTWDKLRFVYQRIVRTESMNTYVRAQLEEWRDAGFKQVTRHCIGDIKTCQLCRTLAQPPNNVYDIDELLRREYCLTEDSHPNCRCSFSPVVNWDELREMEKQIYTQEPPKTFNVSTTVKTPTTTVENVPLEYASGVDALVRRAPPENVPKSLFVPDVVDDPIWIADREEYYRALGLPENLVRYSVETEQKALRGTVTSHRLSDGTLMVTRWAGETGPAHAQITREDAFRKWEKLPKAERAWWRDRWKTKKAEMGYTLEDQGIEIIGGTNFPSPLAEKSVQDYFAECWTEYIVEPIRLFYLDMPAYLRMKNGHFDGQEFSGPGGIRSV